MSTVTVPPSNGPAVIEYFCEVDSTVISVAAVVVLVIPLKPLALYVIVAVTV
mgnify:CR=1 FL=1